MSRLFLLIAILASACLPDNSEACQRCGIFGRGCRFATTYYYQPAAVAYAQPASVQTFNFVNSYPTALLSQGNSVYGYSLAAQAYTIDPAQVLDRSSRLAELAFTSGQKAIDDFNETAGTALALSADASRRSQNTLLALSAIQANNQSEQPAQSLSFRATVTNGKLSLERIEAAPAVQSPQSTSPQSPCKDCAPPPAPTPPDGTLSLSAAHVGLSSCAKCHDGTGRNKTPAGLVIDDKTPLTPEQYKAAAKRVLHGEMPPNSPLSDDQRLSLVRELANLSQ